MNNHKTVKEIISRFQLTSDLFFSVVLEDIEVCQEVVQILTNSELQVLEVKQQFTITSLTNHSIRLDILAQEVDNRKIGMEMHPQSNENRVKRSRYNVGSIDVQTLKMGQSYQDLLDLIHIYITKADFLKTKRGINHIKRSVRGTEVEVPNGVEEYYICLSCEGDTPEQTALMQYMLDSSTLTESTIFPKLVERVKYLKEENGGHEIMCEIMDELLRQEREEVLAEVKGEMEGVRAEAEKAKVEAEKAKVEAEKAKVETEKAKVETEKAKIEIDKMKTSAAKGIVETLLELNFSSEEIIKKLMEKLQLKEIEAQRYLLS